MSTGAPPDLAGHRDRLLAVAYGMLGSVADAEDVVQDVGETWAGTDHATIDDAEAWLVTVTTRRCLDLLRSARRRREAYVGPWLPEPIATDPVAGRPDDPADEVARADEVSFALLVVLDELAPAERVAFVLHDVFGEPFDRVAAVVGRTPEATRQLASRARRRVRAASPTPPGDAVAAREVTDAFFEATTTGDLDALLALLAPDAVLVSDGGGIVSAARRPVHGADRVARFVLGVAVKLGHGATAEPITVGGEPGVRVVADGQVVGVATLDVRYRTVHGVRIVVNPDKLHHVGPATVRRRSRGRGG